MLRAMFTELRLPSHLSTAPISFAALMELYERNYIALRRLCPEISALTGLHVSAPEGAARLYLRITERTRYTTTLELDHRVGDSGRTPSLLVRIYHDARQAEVLIAGVHPGGVNCDASRDGHQRGISLCWQANRFLNEWLNHCLSQHHRFDSTSATA